VYGTLEQQQQQQADNTFEPGEGLPEQGNGTAAGEQDEEAAPAAEGGEDAAAAAVAAPKPAAAPTAEQLTAIKAAVANAQTLEEAWQLEQALRAGAMPSELERKEEQQQQQQQQQQADGAAAMDEG
jgi:U2 small nuclear ribonucleoprotein A'